MGLLALATWLLVFPTQPGLQFHCGGSWNFPWMWGEQELGPSLPGRGVLLPASKPRRGCVLPDRSLAQLGMVWGRLGRKLKPRSWGLPVLAWTVGASWPGAHWPPWNEPLNLKRCGQLGLGWVSDDNQASRCRFYLVRPLAGGERTLAMGFRSNPSNVSCGGHSGVVQVGCPRAKLGFG